MRTCLQDSSVFLTSEPLSSRTINNLPQSHYKWGGGGHDELYPPLNQHHKTEMLFDRELAISQFDGGDVVCRLRDIKVLLTEALEILIKSGRGLLCFL